MPALPFQDSVLYIAPPLSQTQGVLRTFLRRSEIPYQEPLPEILAVPLARTRVERLASGLSEILSASELRDSRALLVPEGTVPTLADLMRMQSLGAFVARVEGQWLEVALQEERFISHFHPIVHTTEPERVYAYECLVRIRDVDGSTIYPGRIFDTARNAELLFNVDRAARHAAIQGVVEYGIRSRLFINFNPTSIYDPAFCLRSTMEAVERAEIEPGDIVFEVVESDEIRDCDHLVRILDFYREAGFGVALDDLGAGYGSLNLLTRLRPDYVKLDMELVRNVHEDPYKAGVTAQLLELARSIGVLTVAEGIEHSEEWRWCREHGADFVQGFLFARPEAPPPLPRAQALLPLN